MPKVILTAQVEDAVKWEAGFQTHADVFLSYNLQAPAQYAVTEKEIAICMEPRDMDAFKKAMESAATAKAMEYDGVKRETVKMFILDKQVKL
jgi:hypothetical protein